jgi:small subunit ribosomal protein S16
MLAIRLAKTGRRNKPKFRLVVSENTKPPRSRALEILGHYDPHSKQLEVKEDRVKHWLEQGSTISPSANNLLVDKGILEGEKKNTIKLKKKKKEELQQKQEEASEEEAPAEEDASTEGEKEESAEQPASAEGEEEHTNTEEGEQ